MAYHKKNHQKKDKTNFSNNRNTKPNFNSRNSTNNSFNKKGNKNKRKNEGPKELLGIFQHKIDENSCVVKIQSEDFPFPNSPVFQKDKQIGKVDEVFGKMEESYASIIYEKEINEEEPFLCNKFLKREWLLPRTETLKKKEKTDKKFTKENNFKQRKDNFKQRSNDFKQKGKTEKNKKIIKF